jgi:hypothetical protein
MWFVEFCYDSPRKLMPLLPIQEKDYENVHKEPPVWPTKGSDFLKNPLSALPLPLVVLAGGFDVPHSHIGCSVSASGRKDQASLWAAEVELYTRNI